MAVALVAMETSALNFDLNLLRMCKLHTRGVEMEETLVDRCVFSPGGDHLVVCGHDGEVKIWDCSTKSLSQRFRPGDSQITCVAWNKPQNVVRWIIKTYRKMFTSIPVIC